MKKDLLPQDKTYYKTGLHAHSTVSDGKLTPQELRDAYKAEGFRILAITDHNVIVDHSELNQEDFLMLTAAEMDVDENDKYVRGTPYMYKSRHFNIIAKEPTNRWIPFYNPGIRANSLPWMEGSQVGELPQRYDAEGFNEILAECNRRGFLVTYNHPSWSLESFTDYAHLKGFWGMEYQNSSTLASGYPTDDGNVYQELLNLGNRLVPIFSDDTHRPVQNGIKVLGHGWIMVGAEKLEYARVIEALERGDLYASNGPQIHSLSWEDGHLHITCSSCKKIQVITQTRYAGIACSEDGTPITEASFDMERWLKYSPEKANAFFRLIVTDFDSNEAVTRAYFMDEL